METNFNRGSLKIVYPPLMEYFKNIFGNITENIHLIKDEKKVVTNYTLIELIDKVQSILKMSGLSGVVKVLSLSQESFELLKDVKFDTAKSIIIWETNLKLLTDVESYLKYLLDGALDQPTYLFNQYKELANLINKDVDIKDLFIPKLEINNKNIELQQSLRFGHIVNEKSKAVLVENIKKSHTSIQQLMLSLFAGLNLNTDFSIQENKANHHGYCKKIYDILTHLQEQKISKSYYVLFGIQKVLVCTATPVFNDKFSALIGEDEKELKVNLARIEKTIKNLLDEVSLLDAGSKTGSLRADETIVKENLYFLIHTLNKNPVLKNMPVFQELTGYFDYDFYTEQLIQRNFDIKVIEVDPALSQQADKLIIDIKEELVLLTSKNITEQSFNQHINAFSLLIAKFETFGSKDAHQYLKGFINNFSKLITAIKDKSVVFNHQVQKEVAISVVLLEYASNLLIKTNSSKVAKVEFEKQLNVQSRRINALLANEEVISLPMPILDDKNKESEDKKILVKLFTEIGKEVKKVEEILDTLLKTEYIDEEEMLTIHPSLNNVKGILSVLQHSELSEIIKKTQQVWIDVKELGLEQVDKDLLKNAISWLSGISLFIAASTKNNTSEANLIEERLISKFNDFYGISNESEFINKPIHSEFDINNNNNNNNNSSTTVERADIAEEIKQDINNTIIASESLDSKQLDISHPQEDKNTVNISENIQARNDSIDTSISIDHPILVDKPSDESLLEIFLEEMNEVNLHLENALNALSKSLEDNDALLTLRRGFHTLKGSGKMVGLEYLGEFAWTVEEQLNVFVNANKNATTDLLDATRYAASRFISWKEQLVNEGKAEIDLEKEKNQYLTLLNIIKPTEQTQEIKVATINEKVEDNNITDSNLDHNVVNNTDKADINLELEDQVLEISEDIDSINIEQLDKPLEKDLVITENQEENIEIDGKKIDLSLFELFNQESLVHIAEMKQFLENNLNKDDVQLPYDFMRHAHTLTSISKAVNLTLFSDISSKIEVIANIALEEDYNFSEEQMNVLYNAIESLATFNKKDISGKEKDEHAFLINNLEVIEKDLNYQHNLAKLKINKELIQNNYEAEKEDVLPNQINNHVQEVIVEAVSEPVIQKPHTPNQSLPSTSLEEFSQAISKQFKEVLDSSMGEIVQKVSSLEKEVKQINQENSNVEADTISEDGEIFVNNMLTKVETLLEDKYTLLMDKFSEHEKAKEKQTNDLISQMENIQKAMRKMEENQSQMEEEHKQSIELVRKDLRVLGGMLKKKSEESYQEFLGDEVTLSDSGINLDIDSLDLAQLDHDLESLESNHGVLPNDSFINSIFEEKISTVEDEFDDEIYEISKIEVEEMFTKIETVLEKATTDLLNIEDNNELKRYLHTLKGSVRMAGANKMGAIAHRLESLLDYTESHAISLFTIKPLIQKELSKLYFLEKNPNIELSKSKEIWLDTIESHQSNNKVALLKEEELADIPVKANDVIIPKEEKQYIRIVSNILDDLINAAGEVRLTRTTIEGTLTTNKKLLSDLKNSTHQINKIVKEIEIQAETQIAARKDELFETGKEFDPLEFDRFTRLQELTRFVNEAVSDVKDTVGMMDKLYKTQENAVVQQSIITNYMLDSLMQVRLIPVETISARLYTITRNTAKEIGKHVNLELSGETTQIDRLVLERIQSPLEHLLRNCIAHGIEKPEIRELNNKPQIGKIKINIGQEGNFIIIKISDDGAGVNIQKVKEIGYSKGLLVEGKEYTKEEIVDLIFKSGFSTADKISQVSGRGVGMDVVKNEIFSLGGSIKTDTEEGKYTNFTIVLPVAVATTQAMLIDVADKLVAIPAILVEQVLSIKKPQMEIAYEEGKVNYRGKEYPLYYLGHLLGTLEKDIYPDLKSYNTLILISYLDQEIVIHVDKLETTDEILIKQMGPYFGKISGLLGATLLGDGRQGVVINPILLKDHYHKNILNKSGQDVNSHKKANPLVMVVDDSTTIRRATLKVLEKYGYTVVLAKDGEDGLEQLQTVMPDIILSDIEMPVMDGFEFVRNIKAIDRYKHIPIIMITSRTADKHKNLAYSLGVDGYLGKPYQEDELIKNIKKLLG